MQETKFKNTYLGQFLNWSIRHSLIAFFRIIRWLCDESIEELQRGLRRPQIRRKPVQTQMVRGKATVDKETGAIDWDNASLLEAENRAMKNIMKKKKLL